MFFLIRKIVNHAWLFANVKKIWFKYSSLNTFTFNKFMHVSCRIRKCLKMYIHNTSKNTQLWSLSYWDVLVIIWYFKLSFECYHLSILSSAMFFFYTLIDSSLWYIDQMIDDSCQDLQTFGINRSISTCKINSNWAYGSYF